MLLFSRKYFVEACGVDVWGKVGLLERIMIFHSTTYSNDFPHHPYTGTKPAANMFSYSAGRWIDRQTDRFIHALNPFPEREKTFSRENLSISVN